MGIAAAVPYTSAAKADRGNSSWVPPMRPYAVKGLGTPSKTFKNLEVVGVEEEDEDWRVGPKAMSSRVGLIPNLPLACQRLMRQLAISNDSSVHPRILDGAAQHFCIKRSFLEACNFSKHGSPFGCFFLVAKPTLPQHYDVTPRCRMVLFSCSEASSPLRTSKPFGGRTHLLTLATLARRRLQGFRRTNHLSRQ